MTIPDLTSVPATAPQPVADEAAGFPPPQRWALSQSWRWPAGFAVAAIVLFFVYLHIALHHGFGADGAVLEQQAWSMLNGNPLMRGWTVADISFYSIEIPELAVLEWLHGGIAPDVLSVAEALNLTALVVLVALLAKGRATGREGLVRALVAGGIVCAPIAGANSTLMLSKPDHLATQVFVLAAWLIVERSRPRWWVPVAVAVVLAWARMNDSIVLLEAELPLLVVCAVRVYRRGGALRDQWYDLSLGAAAIAAELIAQLILVTIRAMGGFTAFPLNESFAPVSALSSHIWVTVESTLILYGADFSGLPLKGNLALLTAAAHLIGVALAAVATIYALRRFTSIDLVTQIVTAMLVASVLAYTLLGQGVTASGGAHDVMPVLPAGAVLAGRLVVRGAVPRRLLAVVAAGLALYPLLLAAVRGQRAGPGQREAAGTWLRGSQSPLRAVQLLRRRPHQRGRQQPGHGRAGQAGRAPPGAQPVGVDDVLVRPDPERRQLLRRDPDARLPGGRRGPVGAGRDPGLRPAERRPTRWTAIRSWSGTRTCWTTRCPSCR